MKQLSYFCKQVTTKNITGMIWFLKKSKGFLYVCKLILLLLCLHSTYLYAQIIITSCLWSSSLVMHNDTPLNSIRRKVAHKISLVKTMQTVTQLHALLIISLDVSVRSPSLSFACGFYTLLKCSQDAFCTAGCTLIGP